MSLSNSVTLSSLVLVLQQAYSDNDSESDFRVLLTLMVIRSRYECT